MQELIISLINKVVLFNLKLAILQKQRLFIVILAIDKGFYLLVIFLLRGSVVLVLGYVELGAIACGHCGVGS